MRIDSWLEKNFKQYKNKQTFKKLGNMFCDGILLPRLAMIFGKYSDYEAYLRGMGLQVQKISSSHVYGLVYIRLEDSANVLN